MNAGACQRIRSPQTGLGRPNTRRLVKSHTGHWSEVALMDSGHPQAGLKAGRSLGINFGFPERRFSLFMGLQ